MKKGARTPAKVLHLVQGLEVGGLEHMVVNLINKLDVTRFQASVCCFDMVGSLAGSLREGTQIHFLQRRPGMDYRYPLRLASLCKEENIQILHLHNSTAFFYGVLAGMIARVPAIVYTEHARDVFPNIKVRVADKVLSFLTDRVIVVADFLKRNLIRYEWFNPAKISVVYNGVDGARFESSHSSEEVRSELDIPKGCRTVGIVARLDPIKNHESLFHAMEKVVKCFPDTVLVVIGDGPLRDELPILAEKCNIRGKVRFLGARNDVPRLFSGLDIFVLCSISEGLPLTILEAMAAGKAVIASRVGGIPEVIENGVNGILVPPADTDALAEAIMDLIRDDEKRSRLGLRAQVTFREKFTLDAMVRNYEAIYDSLSPGKRSFGN